MFVYHMITEFFSKYFPGAESVFKMPILNRQLFTKKYLKSCEVLCMILFV